MDVRNLTDYQKDQLLNYFGYSMSQETRARIMAELPRAYNAWAGTRIVKVRSITHGDVTVPLDKCEEQKGQQQ